MTTVYNPTLDETWRFIERRFVRATNSMCYIFRRHPASFPAHAYMEYQISVHRFWGT